MGAHTHIILHAQITSSLAKSLRSHCKAPVLRANVLISISMSDMTSIPACCDTGKLDNIDAARPSVDQYKSCDKLA